MAKEKTKPKPQWVQYRTQWSYGVDKEWQYEEFDTSFTLGAIKETLKDMAPPYAYDNEHFRGFDVKKIDAPPPAWLLAKIAEMHNMSARYMRRAEQLTELYDKSTNGIKD